MLRNIRYVVFLTAVAVVALSGEQVVLASTDHCHDTAVCDETADCETPCFAYDHPIGWITCGEYDGGSSNGHCSGYCGDSYCDQNLEEDAETCYDDCGYCGDSICTSEPEEFAYFFCCEDCGTCNYAYESCADNYECNGGLGCNWASHCCTSIPVTSCSFCDAWEDCVPWTGPGAFNKLCVTKGAACDGQS
jgi:hypothetical protein